jgi:hypothetical protein
MVARLGLSGGYTKVRRMVLISLSFSFIKFLNAPKDFGV